MVQEDLVPNDDPYSPRKSVRQSRARETIDVILQASSQILAKHGLTRLTTNHIAELAGVSVGSLYQYFPGKDAIVHALLEREFNRSVVAILERIEAIDPRTVPLDDAIAMIVERVLSENIRRRTVYREFLLGALSFKQLRFTLDNDRRLLEVLRAKLREYEEVDPEVIDAATSVMLYSLKGVQLGLVFSDVFPDDTSAKPLVCRMFRACLVAPKR